MKYSKLWVLPIMLGFTVSLLWGGVAFCGQNKVVRDYVAVVNGQKISKHKYERELTSLKNRFRASGRQLTALQELELRKNLLENLINRELLYQESVKKGINVDRAQVEMQLKQVKRHYPDEATYKKALERAHYSEAAVRSQLRRAIAIEKLIDQELRSKIQMTDKDARKYYDSHLNLFRRPPQIRASHILVKLSANPSKEEKEKALKKIKEIQKKIKQGADFADMAKKYSDGPSAKRGGDLGYFSRGQMVKPFEEAAFAMDKGQVSDIVQTAFGYHIIKVTDKRPETTIAFQEIKDRLKKYLIDQKLQKMVRDYAANLKKKAKIERFIKELP